MWPSISMLFGFALSFSCAGTQQCPETTAQPETGNQEGPIQHPIVPEFVLKALKSPGVEKAELSLTIETYQNGDQVYEVKGTHNGRPAILSFDEHGNRTGLSYEIPAVVKVSVNLEQVR